MFIESLSPQVFDVIVAINIMAGLLMAGRRFARDLKRPLPDEAPEWARSHYEGAATPSSPSRS